MRFIAGLLTLLCLGCCGSALAGNSCTVADYNGRFAFSSVGSLLVLPPEGAFLLGTLAQSGAFNPDGRGNVFIETNASYNGIILNGNSPATYTVTPDCVLTFSIVLPLPLQVPATFTGVL